MSASTRPAETRRSSSAALSRSQRPNLRVLEESKRSSLQPTQLSQARRASRRPVVRVFLAICFLGLSLVGSLMLRTAMIQNSFEASSLQTSIGVLTQDVQDDQVALDRLSSQLPQKASDLGMGPQGSVVSLNLATSAKPADAAKPAAAAKPSQADGTAAQTPAAKTPAAAAAASQR